MFLVTKISIVVCRSSYNKNRQIEFAPALVELRMDFIIISRDEIEEGIIVRTPYIVVSIADADARPAKLIKGSGFIDAIYLHFDDTDPDYSFGRLPMTQEQAEKIWSFVQKNEPNVGTIVCHCLAGMSRSPAVAVALAEALYEDATYLRDTFNYNKHVYETMKKAINS